MRIALVSRTVVLAGWLLAVVWHGLRQPGGIAVAAALLAVWLVALVRDGRRSPVPALRPRRQSPAGF